MNYYQGDMDRYFRDKAAIARFQKRAIFSSRHPKSRKKIESKFGPLQGTCVTDDRDAGRLEN